MPSANFAIFPWDTTSPQGPSEILGIRTDLGTDFPTDPDDFENAFTRLNIYTAGGLYARVRQWTFSGHVRLMVLDLDGGEEVAEEGDFSLVLDAVSYVGEAIPSRVLADETELVLHGGWHGAADSQPGWDDESSIILDLWPNVGVPGTTDELDDPTPFGVTMSRPILTFQFRSWDGGAATGFQFGRRSIKDDCPVTVTLPATNGGTFDGTGSTGFTLQLGAPLLSGSGGWLVGSVTLTPTAFWPYDRGDGGGPVFDAATGAWLRTPRFR